jgi:hypothetical protein
MPEVVRDSFRVRTAPSNRPKCSRALYGLYEGLRTDTVWAVYVERLRFCICAAASGRVAQVAKTHEARQIGDARALLKDFGGQTITFALVEAPARAATDDPSRVLAAGGGTAHRGSRTTPTATSDRHG